MIEKIKPATLLSWKKLQMFPQVIAQITVLYSSTPTVLIPVALAFKMMRNENFSDNNNNNP